MDKQRLTERLIGLGFFGIFTLIGVGWFYAEARVRRQIKQAKSWTEIPCEIVESAVHDDSVDGAKSYVLFVQYRYVIDGRVYVSDRYDFYEPGGDESWALEKLKELPQGTVTVCYVDPEEPAEAVLSRTHREGQSNLVPIVCLVIGVPGMIIVLMSFIGMFFDKFAGADGPTPEEEDGGPRSDDAESDHLAPSTARADDVALVSPDRVRELLSVHGEVRSQSPSNWQGDIQLPDDIANFYRDVGPLNIAIDGYASETFIPSLSQLWDRHTKFTGTSEYEGFWKRLFNRFYRRWDSDWIVVAIDGSSALIYSIRDAQVLSALDRGGPWEPYEVYPDLNTMAACIAILGSVAVDAADHFTNEDAEIRPEYIDLAFAKIVEEFGDESVAESAIGAAGWGEIPHLDRD